MSFPFHRHPIAWNFALSAKTLTLEVTLAKSKWHTLNYKSYSHSRGIKKKSTGGKCLICIKKRHFIGREKSIEPKKFLTKVSFNGKKKKKWWMKIDPFDAKDSYLGGIFIETSDEQLSCFCITLQKYEKKNIRALNKKREKKKCLSFHVNKKTDILPYVIIKNL